MNDLKSAFSLCGEGKKEEDRLNFSSIRERVESFVDYEIFSTPGHKGEIVKSDITEYDEDRLFPGKQIEIAEEKASNHYGVKKIRFSVGGSSLAIKASLLAIKGDVIAPSFSHRCLREGLALAGKKGYFFDTKREDGLPAVPTVDDYLKEIQKHKTAKALFVTSPDYFGRVADVKAIRSLCDEYGLLLIADCAHGAHFASRRDLFPDGAEKYAHFACLSAHKTLRSLTQSAYTVIGDERYFDAFGEALTLLGTSSPSYLLLSSLEEAIAFEQENGERYTALCDAVKKLKASVPCLDSDDILRIVVKAKDGEALYHALIERKIMPETYFGNYCVFIVTLSDSVEKVERLRKTLLELV